MHYSHQPIPVAAPGLAGVAWPLCWCWAKDYWRASMIRIPYCDKLVGHTQWCIVRGQWDSWAEAWTWAIAPSAPWHPRGAASGHSYSSQGLCTGLARWYGQAPNIETKTVLVIHSILWQGLAIRTWRSLKSAPWGRAIYLRTLKFGSSLSNGVCSRKGDVKNDTQSQRQWLKWGG